MLTAAIRAQLVVAAARLHGLPASAYLGLVKGDSCYGFDPATNTCWAGGALDPSPSSQQAQVSVQDDGGYYIVEEPSGGSLTASAEGLAGIEGGKVHGADPARAGGLAALVARRLSPRGNLISQAPPAPTQAQRVARRAAA